MSEFTALTISQWCPWRSARLQNT